MTTLDEPAEPTDEYNEPLESDDHSAPDFIELRSELFDGDSGALSLDQRLCLIALLKNTFISGTQHPTHWQTLTHDEVLIKGRLNDLLLDLVIDHEREVAYKVQIRDADGLSSVPPLLKAATYTREETALLVFLRGRYTSDRTDGLNQVHVDRDELQAHIESLRPEHATDISGDRAATNRAIASLLRSHIIHGSQDSESFRVSPVIESLLPVEQLKSLAEWFAAQNRAASGGDATDGVERDDGE